MTKFILRTLIFILPAFILYGITVHYYKIDRGDLLRIGYIMDNSNYREIFEKERNDTIIYYDRISNFNNKTRKYTILTIGDSFSDRKTIGNTYTNYLAKNANISLLLFDKGLTVGDNPIQMLLNITKGDILDSLDIEYIILQSVERDFVERNNKIDFNTILTYDTLVNRIQVYNSLKPTKDAQISFFSSTILKVPVYNIFYNFNDRPFYSKTYKVATSEKLFTHKKSQLLFYRGDKGRLTLNNKYDDVFKLNETLNLIANKLEKRGIKLIVLPSPDKYDIYHDYILDKTQYPKPLFFDIFDKMDKQYLYVNSKKILMNVIKTEKDLYLYDDSHWSPKGARIIEQELRKVILNK